MEQREHNSKYTVINTLFFLLLVVMGTLFYVLPDKPTVSEKENRELAKEPEFSLEALFDGSYTSEYTTYFADNFPFREELMEVSQTIKSHAGTTTDDGSQIIDVANNDDTAVENFDEEVRVSNADIPVIVPSDTDAAAEEEDPDAAFDDAKRVSSSLYVSGDTAMTLTYQVPSVVKNYAFSVNTFAETYPEVQVYCAVAPLSAAYYLPEKYRTDENNQVKMIENIYAMLNENVKTVDIYSKLAHHADEYIYFRTDHHWTALGAYYAYCAFTELKGETPMDISKLEVISYPDYLGSLYNQVGSNQAMRNNPDEVIAYDIDAAYELEVEYWEDRHGTCHSDPLIQKNYTKTSKYLVFTKGDWRFIKIKTQNTTGKSILVFKDSFGNPFVPYLVENYDTIYVADPRYSLPSIYSLIKNEGVDDVLFLTNLTNTSVNQRVKEYMRLYYI